MQRVTGRYAATGHLRQNCFYSCLLAPSHLWTAIAYVERNPVRARIVRHAEDYLWSSALAHAIGRDASGLLDMDWWRRAGPRDWLKCFAASLRRATRANRATIPSSTCAPARMPSVPSAMRTSWRKWPRGLGGNGIGVGQRDGPP